jgi:hypothetical protein
VALARFEADDRFATILEAAATAAAQPQPKATQGARA